MTHDPQSPEETLGRILGGTWTRDGFKYVADLGYGLTGEAYNVGRHSTIDLTLDRGTELVVAAYAIRDSFEEAARLIADVRRARAAVMDDRDAREEGSALSAGDDFLHRMAAELDRLATASDEVAPLLPKEGRVPASALAEAFRFAARTALGLIGRPAPIQVECPPGSALRGSTDLLTDDSPAGLKRSVCAELGAHADHLRLEGLRLSRDADPKAHSVRSRVDAARRVRTFVEEFP